MHEEVEQVWGEGPGEQTMHLDKNVPWPGRKLSGWKIDGFSQTIGSLWIFCAFMIKRVPAGTWYPETLQSSIASRGAKKAPAGYKRRVSLMMAWRYTRFCVSDSSTSRSLPTGWSNSSCAFFNTWPLFKSKQMAHVRVPDVVLLPPRMSACTNNLEYDGYI